MVLITNEEFLPYDRPKLSKAMQVEQSKIQFRTEKFYDEANIDVLMKTTVSGVDVKTSTITLTNGESSRYDAVLLATGSISRTFTPPEKFTIPGASLKNIFTVKLRLLLYI